MWNYSSRGPGQYYGNPGMNNKPDVTAPTPRNGSILYGDRQRIMPNGWGTSGACPQAAGLAALITARNPSLSANDVYKKIRDAAYDLGHGRNCQGAGLFDCGATLP